MSTIGGFKVSINPVISFVSNIQLKQASSKGPMLSRPDFHAVLSTFSGPPPSPDEVKALASYLEWRMKATLFGLVGDNNPSPPLIFMTPLLPNRNPEPTVEEVVAEAARENQLDPRLIRAIIKVESAGNPRAVSPKGAMGLMQLMPETARSLGVKDPFDIKENIQAGARYLKSLIDRYHGNVELALAAYNWGPGNLEKSTKSMPLETVQYVAKVKKYWGEVG